MRAPPPCGADPYDLLRFVTAQAAIYDRALGELRAGSKRSHWMWFVFPQLAALGLSPTARRYAIRDLDEAVAYLEHPLLGRRLLACTEAVMAVDGRSVTEIFGSPDDLKFRSSMTLFAQASAPGAPFADALSRYFQGEPDRMTIDMLQHPDSGVSWPHT